MNILIVDDNKNNRMILKLLLEDYMESHDGIDFFIDEAEDGQVAVNKCDSMNFDMVLMDIMMPIMDGIEATKIIREKDKKIMIIAVSAVDDSERKKLILSEGAEDYISKPVNADIFVSRITNYITLCEHRKTKITHSEVVANLFTKDVYRRCTKFILNDDDALAEFWEFFLLEATVKYDFLSDVVRTIFSIVEKQINISNNNVVYIEESESKQYFTLVNIDVIPNKVIELLLVKNGLTKGYILTDNKLSFELVKTEQNQVSEDIKEKAILIQSEEIPTIIEEEEIASPVSFTSTSELSVMDYIDSDDLYDLEEYANKLSSIMLIVGGGDITDEEVVDIYTYLEKLGSILATYSEVYPISHALTVLSVDMSSHIQEFMDNSEALGPMCKAFSNDMSNWIDQSFHTGAPSADFMNDTIVVNCQTIGSMLKMDEQPADDGSGDDFDDIFDF